VSGLKAGGRCARFVPAAALALLGKADCEEVAAGDSVEAVVTVMFVDLRRFTTLAEAMELDGIVRVLNQWFGCLEPLIAAQGGFVDKYIGDAVMAVFPGGPDAALHCAGQLLTAMADLNRQRVAAGQAPLRAGIGINTGIAALAAIGSPERLELTVVGDAVNIASRIEATTKAYGADVLLSEHSYNRLTRPDDFRLRFIDRILVRGKQIPLSVYEYFGGDSEPLGKQKAAAQADFDRAVAYYHYGKITDAQAAFERCAAACPGDAVVGEYLRRCQAYRSTGVLERAVEMMAYPQWGPEFSVGHAVIDAHHRKLFESVALLMRMIDADDYGKLDSVIDFLAKYVDVHFKTEERLMEACDYPFYRDHKAQHERFTAVFSCLVEELADPGTHGAYIAFRVRILVVDWLLNHTTKSDPHLGKYLARAAC